MLHLGRATPSAADSTSGDSTAVSFASALVSGSEGWPPSHWQHQMLRI
jgi:hypothetical protein